MKQVTFHGRRAAQIENGELLLTVTQEGGHLAELRHKGKDLSPLWIPAWRSIEPSEYSLALHPEYGEGSEARLVAGIFGHSICLDLFGGPGPEEAAAGIPVHGEASIAPYEIDGSSSSLVLHAYLPKAELTFERRLELAQDGVVLFTEETRNLAATDRPIGWTQHVTLGAPFLEPGSTRFLLSATKSKVIEEPFNGGLGMQVDGAEFDWPLCPRKDGGHDNLATLTTEPSSAGFTAHQMNPAEDHAFFLAWSPRHQLAFGYVWHRADFPWLSRWEENRLRPWAPWNSSGFALGMEFGVSPMVASRRDMVERGPMFGTPTFRWIPAQSRYTARYCAFLRHAATMPTTVAWDGDREVILR